LLFAGGVIGGTGNGERGGLFLATDLTQHDAQPEGTEQLQIRRLPFDEVLAMVQEDEITDALSVMAILRYALMRQNTAPKVL
jgi:hypothetical protein